MGLVYAACVIPPKEGMVAQEIMNAWGGESWYDPALMQESQMGYVSSMNLSLSLSFEISGAKASRLSANDGRRVH